MRKLNWVKLVFFTLLGGATVTGCATSDVTRVSQDVPITYKTAQLASYPRIPNHQRAFVPKSVDTPSIVRPIGQGFPWQDNHVEASDIYRVSPVPSIAVPTHVKPRREPFVPAPIAPRAPCPGKPKLYFRDR